MKQTRIVPFDINKAKNGAKIVTRNGLYPARIGFFDLEGTDLPVVAAIKMNGKETPFEFTIEGNYYPTKEEDAFDLFIEEEVEVRFMTLEELSFWLSEKPHRQCMITTTAFIASNIGYNLSHKDDKAEAYLIREDGGEWHKPLIEESNQNPLNSQNPQNIEEI